MLRADEDGQDVADALDEGDVLEYWKSTPFALNFMEDYKLKKLFDAATSDTERRTNISKLLTPQAGLLLDWKSIEGYAAVDLANARLRYLAEDTLGRGAWKTLWMPPALGFFASRLLTWAMARGRSIQRPLRTSRMTPALSGARPSFKPLRAAALTSRSVRDLFFLRMSVIKALTRASVLFTRNLRLGKLTDSLRRTREGAPATDAEDAATSGRKAPEALR
jgi:hypothetical protein